jgi:hypothetical protein
VKSDRALFYKYFDDLKLYFAGLEPANKLYSGVSSLYDNKVIILNRRLVFY